jgi:hypothetical protein
MKAAASANCLTSDPAAESFFATVKLDAIPEDIFISKHAGLCSTTSRYSTIVSGGIPLFDWYNYEPYLVGLNLLTPASVYYGQAEAVRQQRQAVLAAAYAQCPQRFVRGEIASFTEPLF